MQILKGRKGEGGGEKGKEGGGDGGRKGWGGGKGK